tara:strand:- start:111 stop:533 length:423 start_codon:yes stop_codon:yes gene_type:complete
MSEYTPFKMKGMDFGNSPSKQKVDPDAPGTPGKPGYEPPVTSMDYLTKTPNPTVKAQKSKSTYDEKEEQTIENMSNAKDNNFDGHMEMKINSLKKVAKGMNKGISKVKKIHPSFPATPKGNKQRSKAERAQEAKEDAEGK